MIPKVVNPGGIFNETGEDRARLYYGLETGSGRTGLFRRTLELSFLPRAAPSGNLRSPIYNTTQYIITDITASVDYFPTSLAHSSNRFSRLDFDTDSFLRAVRERRLCNRDERLPTIHSLSELPIADRQSWCRLYGRLYRGCK